MNKKTKVLLASAAAGLVTLAMTASPGTSRAEEAPAKLKCYGANTCKGTGECGGKGHSCAGKNECKGAGWTLQTKDACLAMKDGRLTPEPEGGAGENKAH